MAEISDEQFQKNLDAVLEQGRHRKGVLAPAFEQIVTQQSALLAEHNKNAAVMQEAEYSPQQIRDMIQAKLDEAAGPNGSIRNSLEEANRGDAKAAMDSIQELGSLFKSVTDASEAAKTGNVMGMVSTFLEMAKNSKFTLIVKAVPEAFQAFKSGQIKDIKGAFDFLKGKVLEGKSEAAFKAVGDKFTVSADDLTAALHSEKTPTADAGPDTAPQATQTPSPTQTPAPNAGPATGSDKPPAASRFAYQADAKHPQGPPANLPPKPAKAPLAKFPTAHTH